MRYVILLIICFSFPYVIFANDDNPKITNVEVVENLKDPSQPKDECFIATAAYGSKFEPHVATLRQFRDEILLTNNVGRTFVDYYYKHSPPLADLIRNSETLKQIVRIGLTPIVILAYLSLNTPIFVGLLMLIVSIFILKQRRLT